MWCSGTSSELAVFAYLPSESIAVPAGMLGIEEQGAALNGADFVYGLRYLDRPNAIEIDPVSLIVHDWGAVLGAFL